MLKTSLSEQTDRWIFSKLKSGRAFQSSNTYTKAMSPTEIPYKKEGSRTIDHDWPLLSSKSPSPYTSAKNKPLPNQNIQHVPQNVNELQSSYTAGNRYYPYHIHDAQPQIFNPLHGAPTQAFSARSGPLDPPQTFNPTLRSPLNDPPFHGYKSGLPQAYTNPMLYHAMYKNLGEPPVFPFHQWVPPYQCVM